jgi:hypothetical protein
MTRPKVNTIWKHKTSGEIFVVGPRGTMNSGEDVAITINMSNDEGGFEVWRCNKFFDEMEHMPVTQDDIIKMLEGKQNAS